jgi:hypothetical protein
MPQPNSFIHLFTTHLQASYYDNEGDTNMVNDRARWSQIEEMLDFVKRTTQDDPSPILLTGDFNLTARKVKEDGNESSPEYIEMMRMIREAFPGALLLFALTQPRPSHSSTFPEYEVTDTLHDSYGSHPLTYGDVIETGPGQFIPRDTVLTCVPDHCMSAHLTRSFIPNLRY